MAMRTIQSTHTRRGFTDRSYNFIDKDPLVDVIRTAVQRSGKTYRSIALDTGLSHVTINRLFSGQTRKPTLNTILVLGAYFNMSLTWTTPT
jgi:transcriptional regulator with XRE-family HTH domain